MNTIPVFSTELVTRMAEIASILRENHMPQEMINLILASRTGLPMRSVDPMSPVYEWAEKETVEDPAPEAQPRSLDECREAVLRTIAVLDQNDVVDVLTGVLNRVLATTKYTATVKLHRSISYEA